MPEKNLRLPWTTRGAPDPLDDYLSVVDCEGHDICTVYATHSSGKASQIKYILEMCNPKPQAVAVDVEAEDGTL